MPSPVSQAQRVPHRGLKTRFSGILAGLVLICLGSTCEALEITFSGGQPNLQHYLNDGTTQVPVDGSFQFQVGAFETGFSPEAGNTGDWLDKWTPVPGAITPFATVSNFFGSYSGFAKTFALTSNPAGLPPGKQVYIWGFDNRDTAGPAEWILMTHPTGWKMPNASNPVGNAETWTVGLADKSAMGIGSIGGDNSMNFAAVTVGSSGTPQITIADGDAGEDGGSIDFDIGLSQTLAAPVTVDYSIVAETATAGSDFTVGSGTVTIPAGDTLETLSVAIAEDLFDEVDETFCVQLSNPQGAALVSREGVGTIVDNDPPPTISIGAASAQEDGGSVAVPIALSVASGKVITATFGRGPGSLTEGTDISTLPSSVTIAPGETSTSVVISLIDDSVPEIDKDCILFIDEPSNADLGTPFMSLVVRDDDALAELEETGSLSKDPATGDVTLGWDAVAGRTYHVLFSSDLVNWSVLAGAEALVAGSASETFVHSDAGPARGFYKIADGAAPDP